MIPNRRRSVALTLLGACAVALVAFFYRFNTLDGSLGGFTNDHFAQLMRAEMLLRGEQPLRDFADAEMRGAWPALSYALPAWAQQVFGRTLLAEAYMTIGALALAAALVFLVSLDLSGRWSVALLGSAVVIVMEPRLYGYPKVLMLALGAMAIRSVTRNPTTLRLVFAALTTAAAVLFRHDGGVYVGMGVMAGLIARDTWTWPVIGRRLGAYVGLTTLCLLPSAVWVQVYEGIPTYLRNNLATTVIEAGRTDPEASVWAQLARMDQDSLVLLSYYSFWAVLGVAMIVLFQGARRADRASTAESRGCAVGLVVMAAVANEFLLRDNLAARLGDAVAPVAVLGAWSAGAADTMGPALARRAAMVPPVGLLVFLLFASWVFMEAGPTLRGSRLTTSPQRVLSEFASVRRRLLREPPTVWSDEAAQGTLIAARYVAECTSPDDYLLVAAEAPEIPVYARRRFAAGQGTVALGRYASEAEQRRAMARLERQSVPIILADAARFEDEFLRVYPLLAKHVADKYRQAGVIAADTWRFLVFVEAGRQPTRMDPHLGLPCFQ